MLCSATDNLFPRDSNNPRNFLFNYIVAPKDGNDTNACKQTEAFIKQTVQQSTIYNYTDTTGKLLFWALNATDSQADTIRKNEAVIDVSQNAIVAKEFSAVLPPLPSSSAQLSDAKKSKELYHTLLR